MTVVVRVDSVTGGTTGRPLEARPGWRRRCSRAFHEPVRRVSPADSVHRRTADDPDGQRAAGRGKPARVRRVRDGGVDAGRIGKQDPLARIEDRRGRPCRLACDRGARRGRIDDLEPEQVDRSGSLVRDLDELVRRRGAAGLQFRDHERRWRPGHDTGEGAEASAASGRSDHHDDDERGEPRAPGMSHFDLPAG